MRPLRAGEVLDGRYRIEAHIATGGMGAVYTAHRTRLGDLVAVKIIDRRAGNARLRQKQFMREAQLCAMLHHPHIVSVLDFSVESSIGPYLVMEYLNGPSLKQQLEKRKHTPFEFADVCRIVSQVASALDLAHSMKVVHRDLKPGNVMTHRYSTGDVVHKVIDFGIGALQGPVAGSPSRPTSTPGPLEERVLLTIAYASPEQLRGDPATPRSDVYSLGVTVYELLTGRRPFAASETGPLIAAQLHDRPERPSRRRAGIPPAAEAAVLKALAKDPQSRWASAGDFARAFGSALPPVSDVAASSSRLRDVYDLGAVIGRGRLGSVIYEGKHRATGHPVAVRIMTRKKIAQWDAARTRFLREARTTPVNHPSILRVRDYGEEPDQVYVVTDFVPGLSLREALDREGAFSWDRGRPLLADLISATRALHGRGLLALGLTPSIIRLTTDGDRERLVISLAGVADIREVLARDTSSRTRASISESAFYVAPEVLGRIQREPDRRTDLFMIGAIGYELFTGRRPFAARTLEQLVEATCSDEIPDPLVQAPSLPIQAAVCLMRCLARRPDQRFSDVGELETAWEGMAH